MGCPCAWSNLVQHSRKPLVNALPASARLRRPSRPVGRPCSAIKPENNLQPINDSQSCVERSAPVREHTPEVVGAHDNVSTSGSSSSASFSGQNGLALVAALVTAECLRALLVPEMAHAEGLSSGAFEIYQHFVGELEALGPAGPLLPFPAAQLEALGPAGPLLLIVAIIITELVPLFPTQPLSITSGLLFGPVKVPYGPYAVGTLVGLSGWCILYASLGGAGRVLLDNGSDLSTVMAGLLNQASGYSSTIATSVIALMATGGLGYVGYQKLSSPKEVAAQKLGEIDAPSDTSTSADSPLPTEGGSLDSMSGEGREMVPEEVVSRR
eukprot:gene26422-17521_t